MSSTYKVPANPDDAGATKTQLRWVYCCFVDVVVLLDYSISTNVAGWFCSREKKCFVLLNPFCWLASICLFSFLSSNSKFVPFCFLVTRLLLLLSTSMKWCRSTLMTLVSPCLFVDFTLQFARGVSLSSVRLLYFIVILFLQIRSSRHPAGVHSDF